MSMFRNLLIEKAQGDPLQMPLTFTANKAGEAVTLNTVGTLTLPDMHYRMGKSGAWQPYTAGTAIELPNIGDSVQFWNNASTLSTSQSNYAQFAFNHTGGISASGNLMSLLNWSDSVPDWGFNELFHYRTALTSLPLFPDTQVGIGSYHAMFAGCSRLVNQKVTLPSPTFYNHTYYNAFRNTPIIEADIDGSLGTKGGDRGFGNCFVRCTSLKVIRVKFTEWYKGDDGTDLHFNDWVYGVPSGGTFYKPSALPEEYGTNRIPEGWTVVNID